MAGGRQAVHRAGPLKQSNKPHKSGRHQSKAALAAAGKGRVGLKAQSRQARGTAMRKVDRRNKAKQLRTLKRAEALNAKRAIGEDGAAPHLIVVIPLSPLSQPAHLHSLLCSACDVEAPPSPPPSPPPLTTLTHSTLKYRFSLAFPPTSDLYALLDIAKVADTVVFVHHASAASTAEALLTVDCCCSQGLASTYHVVQGLDKLSAKEAAAARKTLYKTMEKRFLREKLHSVDSVMDGSAMLRSLSNLKRRRVVSRDTHPHLLAEKAEFVLSEEGHGTLKLSGYVRGRALSVDSLLHIPGLGDFQMAQIDSAQDPHPTRRGGRRRRVEEERGMEVDVAGRDEAMESEVRVQVLQTGDSCVRVLQTAAPAKQESLVSEVILDPMEGEQTWPSEEELKEAEAVLLERRMVSRRVPQGTSDYQAAWITEGGSEDEQSDSEEERELPEDFSECDSVGAGEGEGEREAQGEEDSLGATGTDADTGTLTAPDTEEYDAQMDFESEQRQLEHLRGEREDRMFPDEVDTPLDVPARLRFQRFRGLQSFRHSPWDRLENLPRDYARIFQFENFSRTRKRVLSVKEDSGITPGEYVTVHIVKVPSSFAATLDLSTSTLLVFGLLQHENKMSVVHFVLRRTGSCLTPIRSKEQLVFHCGVRRFAACPIFSQHTPGDKHKFERFFRSDGLYVASVFAPIGFPPQPTLVFRPDLKGIHVLVAMGTLYKVDPGRVVCKRVVLSGHPYKINRRSAVVRYMFFNREDIAWFKPVELHTKYGRKGHIKEPLGTHGHMKCVFDGPLKAQDTILMTLYKRVFPKWTYSPHTPQPTAWSDDTETGV